MFPNWFLVPHDDLLAWVFWLLVVLVILRFVDILFKIREAHEGDMDI